jgi:hypothetical protein
MNESSRAKVTRRQLFHGAAATSLIALLPARLRAEPITVGAAVSAAMAIISALQESNTQAALRRNLANINAKLDTLILGQQEILNQIEALRLFISAELFTQFRLEAERTMFALKDRYDFLLVGGFNRRTEPDFRLLSANVQDATNRLGLYDFGAFVTFMTGVAMSLTLRKVIPTTRGQYAQLRAGFKAKLDDWLSPQSSRGVAKALEQARAEADAGATQLAAYPIEYRHRQRSSYSGDETCYYQDWLVVSGNLNTPFNGTIRSEQLRCRVHVGRERFLSGQLGVAEAIPVAETTPAAPDYSGIPAIAASNDSQYPEVNHANAIRNDAIARMRRVRDLEFVKRLVERASASLA